MKRGVEYDLSRALDEHVVKSIKPSNVHI